MAQEKERHLYFIYITHDHTTPIQRLGQLLIDMNEDAKKYGYSCIFYLANGESPHIVRVNTLNDNRQDFEGRILGELQNKMSHDVNPLYDVEKIVELFNENEFVGTDGNLLYSSVTWRFYVNKNFWTQYNETIIASLYWTMELDKLKDTEFYFDVFQDENDLVEYDEKVPFGPKNLAKINDGFLLLTY